MAVVVVAVVVQEDVMGAEAMLVAVVVAYRKVARYRAGGGGCNAGEHGAGGRQLWDGGQVTQWKYDFINVPFFLLLLPPKCGEMYVSGEEKGTRGEWKGSEGQRKVKEGIGLEEWRDREGQGKEGQGRDQTRREGKRTTEGKEGREEGEE